MHVAEHIWVTMWIHASAAVCIACLFCGDATREWLAEHLVRWPPPLNYPAICRYLQSSQSAAQEDAGDHCCTVQRLKHACGNHALSCMWRHQRHACTIVMWRRHNKAVNVDFACLTTTVRFTLQVGLQPLCCIAFVSGTVGNPTEKVHGACACFSCMETDD